MSTRALRPLTEHEQVMLWEAINSYTEACGGDTTCATISGRRMSAVTSVMAAIESIRRRQKPEAFQFKPFGPFLNDHTKRISHESSHSRMDAGDAGA